MTDTYLWVEDVVILDVVGGVSLDIEGVVSLDVLERTRMTRGT